MLALTKRTEYALIALHHMLEQGAVVEEGASLGSQPPASAREIAERYGVPLPLLMNILKRLSSEGLLVSIRGAKGGYALAVNPRTLTIARLIEVLEGPVTLVDCCCAPENLRQAIANCKTSANCPVRGPMHALHEKLNSFLNKVTVWDICAQPDGRMVNLKLDEIRG